MSSEMRSRLLEIIGPQGLLKPVKSIWNAASWGDQSPYLYKNRILYKAPKLVSSWAGAVYVSIYTADLFSHGALKTLFTEAGQNPSQGQVGISFGLGLIAGITSYKAIRVGFRGVFDSIANIRGLPKEEITPKEDVPALQNENQVTEQPAGDPNFKIDTFQGPLEKNSGLHGKGKSAPALTADA